MKRFRSQKMTSYFLRRITYTSDSRWTNQQKSTTQTEKTHSNKSRKRLKDIKTTTGIYPTLKRNSKKGHRQKKYPTRITFSRMIGKQGISLGEYKKFVE